MIRKDIYTVTLTAINHFEFTEIFGFEPDISDIEEANRLLSQKLVEQITHANEAGDEIDADVMGETRSNLDLIRELISQIKPYHISEALVHGDTQQIRVAGVVIGDMTIETTSILEREDGKISLEQKVVAQVEHRGPRPELLEFGGQSRE